MTLILICSFFLPLVPVTETLVNWWVLGHVFIYLYLYVFQFSNTISSNTVCMDNVLLFI